VHYMLFDIETGPLSLEYLKEIHGEYEYVPFDPAKVKLGNLKDQAKIDAKLEESKAKHLKEQTEKRDSYDTDLVAEGALSPLTGRVLAIGLMAHTDPKAEGFIFGEPEYPTEAAMLERFWQGYERCRANGTAMVGFNIHGFDLPFMIQRSYILGVDVPKTLLNRGRYWDEIFIDLQVVWGCGKTYGVKGGLDVLCRMMGIGQKSGSGAEFASLWNNPATKAQAIAYLRNDLIMTRDLADRLGVYS
jgi:DNA polymerase elongation subunit (family B)